MRDRSRRRQGWILQGRGQLPLLRPEPNMDYRIEPTNVYYLTFGNFIPGSLIDADKIGFLCIIAYGILNDGRKKNREVALACAAARMA